jgi:hypothetical protein
MFIPGPSSERKLAAAAKARESVPIDALAHMDRAV